MVLNKNAARVSTEVFSCIILKYTINSGVHFKKIYNLFSRNRDIKDFINNINLIGRGLKKSTHNPNYLAPLSTLVSFNFFREKIINFKIYCEIFRKFNKEEIAIFLPTSKDFEDTIEYWDSSRPSGLCFGLKIDREQNATKYFHIKLTREFKNFPENDYLVLNKIHHDAIGMSFEYAAEGQTIKKYYYYITDAHEILKFLKIAKLDIPIEWIDHIEFTALPQNNNKYIVIFKYNTHKCDNGMEINGLKLGIKRRSIAFFKNEFNVLPSYFGSYDKNIVSIYWSATETPININGNYVLNNTHLSNSYKQLLNTKALQ